MSQIGNYTKTLGNPPKENFFQYLKRICKENDSVFNPLRDNRPYFKHTEKMGFWHKVKNIRKDAITRKVKNIETK